MSQFLKRFGYLAMHMHKLLAGRGVVVNVWPDASFVDKSEQRTEGDEGDESISRSYQGRASDANGRAPQ